LPLKTRREQIFPVFRAGFRAADAPYRLTPAAARETLLPAQVFRGKHPAQAPFRDSPPPQNWRRSNLGGPLSANRPLSRPHRASHFQLMGNKPLPAHRRRKI